MLSSNNGSSAGADASGSHLFRFGSWIHIPESPHPEDVQSSQEDTAAGHLEDAESARRLSDASSNVPHLEDANTSEQHLTDALDALSAPNLLPSDEPWMAALIQFQPSNGSRKTDQLTPIARPEPRQSAVPSKTSLPDNYTSARSDVRLGLNHQDYSSPRPSSNNVSITPLGSSLSSSRPQPPRQYDPLTSSLPRLRTSVVFQTPQDLALHHGIPSQLPPPPIASTSTTNTHSRPTRPLPQRSNLSNKFINFATLSASYLNMLAQDPDNTNTMAKAGVTTVPIKPVDTVIQTGVDPVVPSMDGYDPLQDLGQLLSMGDSWAEQYLTASPTSMTASPDDTPLNEFLSTPLFDDIHDPVIGGIDANMPLFGGSEVYTGDVVMPSDDKIDAFPMGGLYTLSPSASPVDTIDPFATDFGANDAATPAPETPASNSGRRSSGRPSKSGGRRAQATGTRRNISVNQLVPLDAPTQTRNYLTDSATSRKEVPAVFAKKKRARSQAFPEEEEGAIDLSLSMTEREQIEAKRRQNTLAARKSRKRKLEHTQQLEASVQFLTEQLELWKGRATMLQGVCRDHGLPCPTFEDQ